MTMTEHAQQQAADAAATVSIATGAAAWALDLQPYIELGAGVVAIMAGLAAAWYHVDRTLAARRERKKNGPHNT